MSETKAPLKSPPAVKGPWILGSAIYFTQDPLNSQVRFVPEYGGIFQLNSSFLELFSGIKMLVIVSNPDYVKHLMQENNRNYRKSFGYEIMQLLLGQGLLTSEGDFWRRQRRLMQPAFHRARLAALANIMTGECKELLKKWNTLPHNSVINLSRDMMEMTLTIVSKAMFSTDVDDAIDVVNREFNIANEKLIRRITRPFKLPLWIPTPGNNREKRAYSAIQDVVTGIIEKRRKSGERYDDLMAMLMEAKDEDTGEMMSNNQIRDEVVTIFLAGHETTAVALTWLFHCLDENPIVKDTLMREVKTVLNGRAPELNDLPQLDYTRMVIEETLRLYPPAWIIGRRANEDDEIDGYFIAKDTNCLIPVYQIHRDERHWEEPLKFKPERFSKENSRNRHKFVYFPFGGGPRLCIGNNFALMEMQLAVPMILQQFDLYKPGNFKFRQDPLITMRPEPDMKMIITKRAG